VSNTAYCNELEHSEMQHNAQLVSHCEITPTKRPYVSYWMIAASGYILLHVWW